jgi:hypothetical protein
MTPPSTPPHPLDRVEPDPVQREKLRDAQASARWTYEQFAEGLPEGRYKALALTHLEAAAMWASKAITHTPR